MNTEVIGCVWINNVKNLCLERSAVFPGRAGTGQEPRSTSRAICRLGRGYAALVALCMPLLGAATVVAAPQLQPVDDVRFVELASEWLGVKITIERIDNCRVGRTSNGQFVVLTADYATPRGYRGPTSLMLLINSDLSTILNAALVESCDSPAYVRRAVKRGLIEQFKGRRLEEQVPLSVDAVSGATRTCVAVEQAVNQTLERIRVD